MMRNDGAVFLDAGLHFDDRRVARIAGGQLLGVIHHHLDRHAGLLRQEIRHRHVHEAALAAEVAADMHRMEDNFFLGDADAVGQLAAHGERRLAARPDIGAAVGAGVGDAGMRF